jgi:hypothetical protein
VNTQKNTGMDWHRNKTIKLELNYKDGENIYKSENKTNDQNKNK